jgi:hypothetical protein
VTGLVIQLTMVGMASKPGRRIGTPSQYRDALMERVASGLDKLEAAGWSSAQIADELTKRVGRPISYDTARKWGSAALIPHDVIMPFCDMIEMHVFAFLAAPPFEEPAKIQVRRNKTAA